MRSRFGCVSNLVRQVKKFWVLAFTPGTKFLPPRKSSILIYDATNANEFLPYTNHLAPHILHTRNESINLWCLFLGVIRYRKRPYRYFDAYIDAVEPKIIITFIDNDIRFYGLRSGHPTVKTLFVQNGCRSAGTFDQYDKADIAERRRWRVDYMLVFGNEVATEYNKRIAGRTLAIGSFKNNQEKKCEQSYLERISFVSTYIDSDVVVGEHEFRRDEFTVEADTLVLNFLNTYAAKHNKELEIILRHREDSDSDLWWREIRYFCRILGDHCKFAEQSNQYSSYDAVDRAGVVVTIDSTLGYESLARGNRTALFCIRGELLGLESYGYGWSNDYPDEGIFWTNHADLGSFSRILDRLFEYSEEEWMRALVDSQFSKQHMGTDGNNSIFRTILERELG